MWKLCLAALLATTTMVQAQRIETKTIKLHNKATGEQLGTITITGNTAYLRDKDGVHTKTIVQNPDGTTTAFDPYGNIVAPIKLPEREDAQ